MTEGDDRRLRALFRDLHEESDPPAPPYAAVARAGRGARRARSGATLARLFAMALIAGVLLLVVRGLTTRAPGDDEAIRLASQMTRWEAPTDFLLETPGVEYLQTPPTFGAGAEALPGDSTDPTQEEAPR